MTPGILSEPLLRDFVDFARWRLAAALGLVIAGALLEGAGILLLVPMLGVALGGLADGSRASSYVDPLFDMVGADTPEQKLLLLLGIFALVVAFRFGVLLRRDIVLQRLSQDFIVRLRSRAFRSLAAKPWAELARLQHGPVGHALTRDVDRAENGVQVIVAGATAFLILTVQISLALTLSPAITVFAVVAGAIGFRMLRWLRNRSTKLGESLSAEDLQLYSSTHQFLTGLKPSKAHGMEGEYVDAFERSLRDRRAQVMAWMVDQALARLMLQTGAALTAAGAVLAGVFWLDLSTEVLIVTVLILARVYGPVLAIQNLIQGVRHAAAGYRVARELAEGSLADPDPVPAAAVRPLDQAPEIALADVTMRSDEAEGRPILQGVTCCIPAGKVTALVGASGAGKTTLSDLAIGLVRPDEGEVRLDGLAMDDAAVARLGASLAYVGQEPFMLARSLRDNLRWGTAGASDDRLYEALELTGARRLAEELEGGLDGWVRAEGARFSGGERQRLRLARAWLRRPRLMVLDEATGALDPDNEHRLLDRLLAARDGATVLMITHRPATALRADHLILLDSGRVVEAGPPEELSSRPGGAFETLFARALVD